MDIISTGNTDRELENPDFLSKQLITCLGNKRALLEPISNVVETVKKRLGKRKLRLLDAFAGSGVVSRLFKAHAQYLASNDIEDYATAIARCFLRNHSEVNLNHLQALADELNAIVETAPLQQGFIERIYAPHNEDNITLQDRVFYTKNNAKRLDNYRRLLNQVEPDDRRMLLAPLISKASIHANTSGVFKGFHKNRETKIGQYGGSHSDALHRIKGQITLEAPVLSRFECDVEVFQEDANEVVKKTTNLDLAYFDPPYNQHPYGSNYFMLNLLTHYNPPHSISKISGIPTGWKRSDYNNRTKSFLRCSELIKQTDARFLLISFNNEGFIDPKAMIELLKSVGKVEVIALKYNAFRGSRNLKNRNVHVTEQLFLVEK